MTLVPKLFHLHAATHPLLIEDGMEDLPNLMDIFMLLWICCLIIADLTLKASTLVMGMHRLLPECVSVSFVPS